MCNEVLCSTILRKTAGISSNSSEKLRHKSIEVLGDGKDLLQNCCKSGIVAGCSSEMEPRLEASNVPQVARTL